MRPSLPRWVYLPAAVGALFVVVPLFAMAFKVDWSHLGTLVESSARAALLLSLRTAAASTLLCLLLGVPLAMVLARHSSRADPGAAAGGAAAVGQTPVVGGLALLYAFEIKLGLLGHYLEAAGIASPSPRRRWCWPRPSSRCRSWSSHWRVRRGPAGSDYDVVAATLEARRRRCGGG